MMCGTLSSPWSDLFHGFRWQAALLLVAVMAPATFAQVTAFQEGFNDQQSGTLYLEGQFIQSVNNMWGPLPGFQPGFATIAYWEQGDMMYDGVTPFPAKRATFFAESQTGDQTPANFLSPDGFALLDAGINWTTDTDGTTALQIQFVVEDAVEAAPTRAFDIMIRDYLETKGHTVTVTDQAAPAIETSDMIFLAAHNDGDGLDASYPTTTVPVYSGYFHESGAMGFASGRGENTNGTPNIDIAPGMEDHPLAAGLTGEVAALDPDTWRQRLNRINRGNTVLADSAKVVATAGRQEFGLPDPEDFTGYEGTGYLRGGDSSNIFGGPGVRAYEPVRSINTVGENPRLVIDVGANDELGTNLEFPNDGPYENEQENPDTFDFIDILIDDNMDGEFDLLATFRPVPPIEPDFIDTNQLALQEGETFSTVLNLDLQTFTFDLPQVSALDLRIEVRNNGGPERIAIDNLNVLCDNGCEQGPSAIAGDYNNNGQVEQADLDLVLLNWGSTVPPAPDGWTNPVYQPTAPQIDQDDLDGVLLNWGNTATAASVVPEPTAILLLLTGIALGCLRVRRM